MVEKMRQQFPPGAERRCPFCPDHVEDEINFLLNWPTFSVHSKSLLSLAINTIADFNSLSELEKFQILMTEENIVKTSAKYIRTVFEVREFLIKPQRSNG